MHAQHSSVETPNKEPLCLQQRGDETVTDAPMYLVHLAVQRSENSIFEKGVLRMLEDIKNETFTEQLSQTVDIEKGGLIHPINIKQEKVEVEIDIENSGFHNVEHIQIEEVHIKSEGGIKEELFEEVKQENSETTENIQTLYSKGHSRDQHIPEQHRTVKEIESLNTNSSTDVSASSKKAAVEIEVSKHTSRCSDSATNRGNVSVDSDNECTTTDTDVGDSSRGQLTNVWGDCGDILDDKHLIQHVQYYDTNRRNNIQKSDDGSAQECQGFGKTGVVKKLTETHKGRCSSECGICESIFNTHLRTYSRKPLFECAMCQRKFNVKTSLNKHLKLHTNEKPFECVMCQRSFTVKRSLNKHLKIHTKQKPFECDICERRFSEKFILNTHLRTHTNEKPFKCAICQQRFSQKGNLNIHLRKHTKEKPFECAICQRRFNVKGNLKKHLRIHSNEKPFECTICQRRFTEKGHLNAHGRTHTKEKSFECTTCQRRFSQKSALNVHSRTPCTGTGQISLNIKFPSS